MGADNYKYNMGINYESLVFYFLVQGLLLCHFEFFFLSVFHLLAFLNPLWAAACTAADTHTHIFIPRVEKFSLKATCFLVQTEW